VVVRARIRRFVMLISRQERSNSDNRLCPARAFPTPAGIKCS
jgi:hypothetical protein